MKTVYLLLAIIGAIVPYIFFMNHFSQTGLGLTDFVQGMFANWAAGGFSADVLISSLVFWIWLWQSKASRIWVYVLLNLSIGLSCALPAYLYMREKSKAAGLTT